jgi:hypothetical protein
MLSNSCRVLTYGAIRMNASWSSPRESKLLLVIDVKCCWNLLEPGIQSVYLSFTIEGAS